MSIPHQFSVHEPFPNHPVDNGVHLIERVAPADAVQTGELVDVALQVLGTNFVINALVRPLEH